ncbi:MAG: AbiU2 domain-containing protein [Rhodocyclaceae bacterium]
MGTDFRLDIAALHHAVNNACLNYDIWWVYKSKKYRPKYVGTMNRYLEFFSTSLHAHFVALLVALYPLYETRRDTFNIPRLLKLLAKEDAISKPVLNNATQLYDEAKHLWLKVCILRNEVFAHFSESSSVEQIFKKADMTPNELKRLLELTKRLLNTVTRALDGSVHAFNLGASEATIRVLEDLASRHRGTSV